MLQVHASRHSMRFRRGRCSCPCAP